MKTKILNLIFTITAFILMPFNYILAATKVDPSKKRLQNIGTEAKYPNVEKVPQEIITNIIIYVLGFVGVFFLAMMIYSGMQWILAGGNEEIITKAKDRLKNSIIGFVIIMAAYALTTFIIQSLKHSI